MVSCATVIPWEVTPSPCTCFPLKLRGTPFPQSPGLQQGPGQRSHADKAG